MMTSAAPAALLAAHGSPLYVYDLTVVRARARQIRAAISWQPFQPLFAIKANPCPAVARAIIAEGYGVDAVSPGEVAVALKLGVRPDLVLYTENNMTDEEMMLAVQQGVLVNCGSLDRLERLAKAGVKKACVRFNPEFGDGAHEKICTAGPLTKFGVHQSLLPEVRRIERETGIQVVGCHMHIGSGFLDATAFTKSCEVIFAIAAQLPHLTFVDVGGGIGIPYRESQAALDLPAMGAALSASFAEFCQAYGRPLELRVEPGRFLVAESGTLYTTVTSVKANPDGRVFVGCDTGFNHLVRVVMYDAYHRISNVTRPDAAPQVVDVVGNICESGDVFARQRALPAPQLGDILALHDAGAYGMAMASTYNTRPLPAEVIIDGAAIAVARRRQTVEELLAAYTW